MSDYNINAVDNNAKIQLQIIQEVHRLLEAQKIPHWLDGGWALDFLLGTITRKHEDVDWLIWTTDASSVQSCLEPHGYDLSETKRPEEHIAFYKQGQYTSFTRNMRNDQGQVVTCGRWSDWPYPDDAFTASHGCLDSIICPVLSPEAQLDVKENYHKHPAGGPLRDVDPPDIDRLRNHLNRRN